MNSPLITTVIPTYRRPEKLKLAIESVLSQTYPNFILQIVDNASGDETAEVVKSFAQKDPRIRYFCQKENVGLRGNFQKALSLVETPYFSFLSDDNLLLPWFYETALKGFQQEREVGLSAGTCGLYLQNWKQQTLSLRQGEEGFFAANEGVRHFLKQPYWESMLFRTEAVKEVGGINSSLQSIFDGELILRICVRFPVFLQKKPCAIFLHHDDSYSSKATCEGALAEHFLCLETIRSFSHLPEAKRKELEELWEDQFFSSLTMQKWVRDLIHNNEKDLLFYIDLLRNKYKNKRKAIWVSFLLKTSHFFPLSNLLKIMQKMNRWRLLKIGKGVENEDLLLLKRILEEKYNYPIYKIFQSN